MNKKELIKTLASKTGTTQKSAEQFLNAYWNTIEAQLASDDSVSMVGYGTYSVRQRASRKTINPKTKTMMTIPAKKVPVFKAGIKLKMAANN